MRACENLIHLPDKFESLDSLQILELHQCRSLQVFPRNFVKFLKLEPFDDEVYDYLPESCKDPFLDVCLFFKGSNWDSVADIVGESKLDLLEKRALVYKDSNMNVKVHEVILRIATKRVEGTRFNFSNASSSQIEEFLKKDISYIKGLWLDEYEEYIPATKLDSMSDSLEILRLGNVEVKGKCNKIFEKLVFFQGNVSHLPFNISQMPSVLKHMELDGKGHSNVFKISPSDFRQLRKNLRILRLVNFAGLEKLPEELGEIIDGLRELSLSYCTPIQELPSSISKLQYLRVLEMYHCYSLRRLPEDFGSLDSLQELNLSSCKSIEELPRSISKLPILRVLKMDGCDGLKRLPEDFGSLGSLEELRLSSCKSIEELPRSITKLPILRVLKMDGCDGLKRLPEEFGSLGSLQELILSSCKSIEELPESASELRFLKTLKMRACENLIHLPDNFESLDSLQVLELQYCDSLNVLPRNFKKFQKLKPFDGDVYASLRESLKDSFLDICLFFNGWNWDSVADIVGESELAELGSKRAELEETALVSKDSNMTVRVRDDILNVCRKRAERTRFNFSNASTSQIEEFIKKDIPGIKGIWLDDDYKDPLYIPALKLNSMSDSLRILRFGNSVKMQGECDQRFDKLVYFQGKVSHLPFNISQMPSSLKHMELDGKGHSHVFKISLNDIQQLRNLRIMRLINFVGLKKLPKELGDMLHELRELTLSHCTSMKEIPRSISNLQHLRVLKMDCCYNLLRLPEDFGSLHSLQELTLSYCTSMKDVPRSISKLQHLRVLKMDCCYNLLRLPEDFRSLTSLQELTLSCCIQMKELPRSISKLKNLRVLKADYCFNLKELPNSELLNSSRELFCKCHEELPKSEPMASLRSESESESESIAKLQSESESESIAKLQSQPESESIAKIQSESELESESESITELQSSKN